MVILSYSNEHEAGAAIVKDGKILSAINEERLSRIKNQDGFPDKSIDYVLNASNLKHNDIEHVIFPEISKIKDIFTNVIWKYPAYVFYRPKGTNVRFSDYIRQLLLSGLILVKTYYRVLIEHPRDERSLRKMFPKAKFHRVEHHIAHAASAYFTSGFEKALIVTSDYWGDFTTSMLSIGDGAEIKPVSRSYYPHSLGHYYASLTTCLGFRANRHEGKILGLAAYGDPNSPVYDMIKDMLVTKGLTIKAPFMIGKMWHKSIPFLKNSLMKQIVDNYSREDISAAFQRRFEEVFVELVGNAFRKFGINKIVLAGGAFANVKLNQRIYEVSGVENVFVYPNMSDGGISQGAALYYDVQLNGRTDCTLPNMYFGPSFSSEDIETALKEENLEYQHLDNIEKEIAKLIAEGEVIARFNGSMELGPRALGNRSILYHTTDPKVNKWLNERLKRTEFMPFAPVTLEEHAEQCYKNFKGAAYTARFMVITFDCTDFMKEKSPATVHIDGTARPQIIREQDNPSYYKIVKEYHKITGIPSLVNTSFNMHEEPIVCTPQDAVRSFVQGHLDYLAIGSFLVKCPKENGNEYNVEAFQDVPFKEVN